MSKQNVRRFLYRMQSGRCCYCDYKMFMFTHTETDKRANHPKAATFEHIIPKSSGTENSGQSRLLACRLCNQLRGNVKLDVFLNKYFPNKFNTIKERVDKFLELKTNQYTKVKKQYENQETYNITKGS